MLRLLVTVLNAIAPNTFDDTFLTYNEDVKSKFIEILDKNEEYNKCEDMSQNLRDAILNEISSSLSMMDKFTFGYHFDHSYTKSLIWNMYNSLGVECQTKFFCLLDSMPWDLKTKKVDVSIGIIEGYTWDVETGQGMALPMFDKVHLFEDKPNHPRPILIIGNLIFDWDPILYLCIPKKCVGDFGVILGNTYRVGTIDVRNKSKINVLEIIGNILIKWDTKFKKTDKEEDCKFSYDLIESILHALSKFSPEFSVSFKSRLEGAFFLSLHNIEYRSPDKYLFEIQDGYFKDDENTLEPLPRELSTIQNKRTHINSVQQLNAYVALLNYALGVCIEPQKEFIQKIIDFVRIYERSLPYVVREDEVEFYHYGEKEIKITFNKKNLHLAKVAKKESEKPKSPLVDRNSPSPKLEFDHLHSGSRSNSVDHSPHSSSPLKKAMVEEESNSLTDESTLSSIQNTPKVEEMEKTIILVTDGEQHDNLVETIELLQN